MAHLDLKSDFLSPQGCRHFLKFLLTMIQKDLKVEKPTKGKIELREIDRLLASQTSGQY